MIEFSDLTIQALVIKYAPNYSILVLCESVKKDELISYSAAYEYYVILSDNSLLYMPNCLSEHSIVSALLVQRSIYYAKSLKDIVVDDSVMNLKNFYWMSFVEAHRVRYLNVNVEYIEGCIDYMDSVTDAIFDEHLIDSANLKIAFNQKTYTWLEILGESSIKSDYALWKSLREDLVKYKIILTEIANTPMQDLVSQLSTSNMESQVVIELVSIFLNSMSEYLKIAPNCKDRLELTECLVQRINQVLKSRSIYCNLTNWFALKELVERFQPPLNSLPHEILSSIAMSNIDFELKDTGHEFSMKYIQNKLSKIQSLLESIPEKYLCTTPAECQAVLPESAVQQMDTAEIFVKKEKPTYDTKIINVHDSISESSSSSDVKSDLKIKCFCNNLKKNINSTFHKLMTRQSMEEVYNNIVREICSKIETKVVFDTFKD